MLSRVVRESAPLGNQRTRVHHSEPSASDRRGRDYNRGCDVSRAEGLDPAQSGIADRKGGFGSNIPGVPFSIRGY